MSPAEMINNVIIPFAETIICIVLIVGLSELALIKFIR